VAIEVLLNHVWMPAVLLGVGGGSTEYFGEKGGNVSRMIGAHVRENRREKRISRTSGCACATRR